MKRIKVIDSSNIAYSWIAEQCRANPDNSAVFVFNGVALQSMIATLAKYGISDKVPVNIPDGFFGKIIHRRRFTTSHICNIVKNQPEIFPGKKGFERDAIIWRYVRAILSEKAAANGKGNITPFDKEEYKTFKEQFEKLGIVTGMDIIKECIDRGIKLSKIKNLFVYSYEDSYRLLDEAIEKCIQPEKVYYVGDPYRYSATWATGNGVNFDSEINLNSALQIPQGMYGDFLKIKKNLNIPYEVKMNGNFGKISILGSFWKALYYFMSKSYEFGCIVYENPIWVRSIETVLFSKDIPFKGYDQRYKFPFELYVAKTAMEKIANSKDVVSYKEVKTLIDCIRADITDRFGGRNKLLETFKFPVISSATLNKLTFFKYLSTIWMKGNFGNALRDAYTRQWMMWRGKLTERWYNPKLYCGVITSMKYLNPEVCLLVLNYPNYFHDEQGKSTYTMMMVTSKELILTTLEG